VPYQALADVITLVHIVFIAFVLLGGLLAFRWRWMPWAHLPAVMWGAAVEFFGWVCPLTPLENVLRRAGNGAGYSVSFVERYLVPLVYPAELTHELQLLLGGAVVAVNALVYFFVFHQVTNLGRARPAEPEDANCEPE
jgi:hypothetical protein